MTLGRSRWERVTNQRGTVFADQSVEVYARVSGQLSKLAVDIGSRVKRGQLLAIVDDPERGVAIEKARAEVQRAEARMQKAMAAIEVAKAAANAEKAKVDASSAALHESEARAQVQKMEADRIREHARRGEVDQRLADETDGRHASAQASSRIARSQLAAASAAELESRARIDVAKADLFEAKSEIRVAETGLNEAEIMSRYTNIEAPFDGVVIRRNYHLGDLVRAPSAGTVYPICTIVQTSTMRVVVNVPDLDTADLDEGDPATVWIDALGTARPYHGQVARTAYALDSAVGALHTEIDLANTDGRLHPGQAARVAIVLAAKENVLTIPRDAIVTVDHEGVAVVYRVQAGRAMRTRVRLGEADDRRVEVLDGLNDGDVVISGPNRKISDGQTVRVERANAAPGTP